MHLHKLHIIHKAYAYIFLNEVMPLRIVITLNLDGIKENPQYQTRETLFQVVGQGSPSHFHLFI